MRLEELEIVLKRRPFTPFRMVLVTGQQFEVKHPEQLMLSEAFAAYGVRELRDAEQYALFVYWIDLAHIVYLCRLQGIKT